ncbi:secretin [Volucribacter amazonae]|uniref:Secretin n=1 Tax=Volucribacter amazonae TaxID=256731 RepID=A0A9X4SR31_9PAST|nr:secretin [Volucribacter amazonae]
MFCLIFFLSTLGLTQNATLSSSLEQQPFSIQLKQAPLVATLQRLANDYHTNLVIDDELTGTISLQLQQTHFEELLTAIAQIKNLSLWQENNIYYLSRQAKLTPLPPENAITFEPSSMTSEKLHTEAIKLHFAKASEVIKSLTPQMGSLLSAQGSLSFDQRSNLILLQDEKASVKNIKKLIQAMDKPIEQIAIEARIVTISDESLKELGVRWGMFNPTEQAQHITGRLEANNFNQLTEQLNVNFAAINPAAAMTLQLAKINGRLLDLELTALERENNVEIIASPRLLTTNKQMANIKQGTEIPYVILDAKNNNHRIEFKEAVLGLEVTPQISPNKHILLDLVVTQNSVGNNMAAGTSHAVSIDKQEIRTQVFAQNGETIVLGGIFHNSITKQVDKVPLLGDLPLIKRLFSKEMERQQRRELVIFVTPYIL